MLYLDQSEPDSILNIMDYSPSVETDSVNIINFVQCLCAYIAFPYRFGAINEPWILNPGAETDYRVDYWLYRFCITDKQLCREYQFDAWGSGD